METLLTRFHLLLNFHFYILIRVITNLTLYDSASLERSSYVIRRWKLRFTIVTRLIVTIDLNLKINNKILDILIKYYTFSHIIVIFIKISE